ncbi:MAG: Rrf2 family transcriptional regulator [Clostridia bacterium]|nr:Rrf2 family transcriptional regulator [Clostridia bacterium]
MMITTKGRNALKLMIDLADHYGEGYISLADIAERQKESVKYLEYTASQLSSSGLIVSARGKSGGYKLARVPEEYTAAEILLSGEGSLAPVHCLETGAAPCVNAASCVTLPLFKELDDVIMNFLNSKTLADLIKTEENIKQ